MQINIRFDRKMNGPQRTASLAKGYNNGKYKWIEVLVMGKKQWNLKHGSTEAWKHGSTDGQTICNS